MKLSEELVWRGFKNQTTFKDLDELDQEKRTFYFGVDPSSSSPQVGNLASMMLCKVFIKHGYKPIMLTGGATGRVGDPKDNEERALQSEEVIEKNVAGLKEAYARVFKMDNIKIVDNYDWFKNISFLEFMRDVGKKFGMGQLLDREFVKARIGEGKVGVSYAEFGYGLIQGYDFYHLFKNHGVTLQLCGSDQWGNCILGVDLIRKNENAEAHVWSMPLIINKVTGRKFGKSEAGTLWLDPKLTSPFELFQFWLNTDDQDVLDYIKIFTEISKDEFDKIEKEFKDNSAERAAQKYLAYESTAIVHGDKIAKQMQKISQELFAKEFSLEQEDIKELVGAFKSSEISEDIIADLVHINLASSKSEARKLLEAGAISVNGVKVNSAEELNQEVESQKGKLLLFKRGKNQFGILKTK